MALLKPYTLETGISCPDAYHVVSEVITKKNPVDKPDPDGVRPDDAPDHEWRAGYYGRVCVEVYYNEQARSDGRMPIAHIGVYPTDMPADLRVEFNSESNMWFTIDLTSNNSIVDQAYSFLETTDYYANANTA